jgi:hypothetical protein
MTPASLWYYLREVKCNAMYAKSGVKSISIARADVAHMYALAIISSSTLAWDIWGHIRFQ